MYSNRNSEEIQLWKCRHNVRY